MRRWMRICSGVALVLAIAGCGGGGMSLGGNNGGGSGGGNVDVLTGPGPISGPAVPASVRYAAMDRVRAKYNELVNARVGAKDREVQLLAFMRTIADFKQVGLSADGTLWARYADKSPYLFNDRAVPDDFTPSRPRNLARQVNNLSTQSRGSNLTPSAGLEVASSKQAYVFETFDGSMGTPNEEIDAMLRKRGYQVRSAPATVEALRSVTQAGVFYISSHGCVAGHPNNPNAQFWSLWTATQATPENDAKYAADIAAGRLVVFEAAYGKSLGPLKYVERRYGITADWVKHYNWSFAAKSAAFINACWSDQSGFTTALRSLPRPVSTTFGWSNAAHPEKAWRAARYLFDRALGTNMAEPKQPGMTRPFSTDEVFAKETALTFTDGSTVDYGPCTLVKGGSNVLLAPSIKRMEVFERGMEPAAMESQLILTGLLGTELPTAVKIDGVQVKGVTVVSETEWRCTIASKPGPGFAGRVEITSAAGIKSNMPPLTSWQGSFQYRADPMTIHLPVKGSIDIQGTFRADIHKFRETVDGPLDNPPASYMRTALDSVCNWKITGALQGWVYTSPTSGRFLYGMRQEPRPYGTGYILDLKIDRGAKTVGVAFNYLGSNVSYTIPPATQTFTTIIPTDNLLTTVQSAGQDRFGAFMFVPKMVATLRPEFDIAKQTFDGIGASTHGNRFDVPAMVPAHAPNDDEEEDVE